MWAAGKGRRFASCLGLMMALIPAVPMHSAPPDIDDVHARNPEALVPGCVTPLLDRDPPGYLTCSLVTKYFDDEKSADLQDELQLSARMQFVRFMTVGRNPSASRAQMTFRGFQCIGMWWEGETLRGLFFIPVDGLLHEGGASDDSRQQAGISPEQSRGPTAAELLLDARTSRMRHDFRSAREMLGRLRNEYPMSPEARRALRELFFVNTAESRVRVSGVGAP